MKINTKIIPRSEPHSIRFNISQLMARNGVYKVVYPEGHVKLYRNARLVSVKGGVIYVDVNQFSIIGDISGWVNNSVEFELVDAQVDFSIIEK